MKCLSTVYIGSFTEPSKSVYHFEFYPVQTLTVPTMRLLWIWVKCLRSKVTNVNVVVKCYINLIIRPSIQRELESEPVPAVIREQAGTSWTCHQSITGLPSRKPLHHRDARSGKHSCILIQGFTRYISGIMGCLNRIQKKQWIYHFGAHSWSWKEDSVLISYLNNEINSLMLLYLF